MIKDAWIGFFKIKFLALLEEHSLQKCKYNISIHQSNRLDTRVNLCLLQLSTRNCVSYIVVNMIYSHTNLHRHFQTKYISAAKLP